MGTFQENRKQIGELRKEYVKLSEKQYGIQQELILLEGREAPGGEGAGPDDRKKLEAGLRETRDAFEKVANELSAALAELYRNVDPRQLVEALDDQLPVLLMPVKVETRFITIKHIGRDLPAASVLEVGSSRPELRSFFKEALSGDGPEIALPTLQDLKAKGFGDAASAIEKEIKKGVLAPGDGQWIAQAPDKKELWVRIFPDDLFLLAHEKALLDQEFQAGKAYWLKRWDAERRFLNEEGGGELRRESISAAWEELHYAFDAPRAKWIIMATQPLNFMDGQTDFSGHPQFPAARLKSATWTEASRTKVLPDRFVVRLYQGEQVKEHTGAEIPEEIALGLDPLTDDFDEEIDNLTLPERLRWLSDFELAEKMGMAVRIPLTAAEFNLGFDRLVVLGVKISSGEQDSQMLLEELLLNHQYKSGGFSFLAQGTPTNQTDKVDEAGKQETLENEAFLYWSGMAEKEESGSSNTCDGQRLSRALGVSETVFRQATGYTRQETEEAAAMNNLLWPATMGYFLQQFLYPLVSKNDQEQTRRFLKDFVSGRGQLPVCRIDDQPYGLLPATVFSRWTYPEKKEEYRFAEGLFQRVLRVLDGEWENLAKQVFHVGDGFTPGKKYSDRLLQMLGLHASSVEFYVRTLVDPFFSEDVMQVFPDDQLDAPFWEVKKELEEMNFYFERFETASRMFDMVFSREVRPLDGPLIDRLPLSETRKVEPLPEREEHYLDWLLNSDPAGDLRTDSSGLNDGEGLPVLYLLLRQAIVREYMNVAISLLQDAGRVSPVAEVDQEREEAGTLGAGQEYYLRAAILLRWQHQVRRQVEDTYRDLLAGGLNPQRITEFEQAVGQAFPFYNSNRFLRKTVDQAVGKLRQQLIPQPGAIAVREAVSGFVKNVEEAIRVQVEKEFKKISGEILVEPDKWKLLTGIFPEVSGNQTMLAFIDSQLASEDPPPVYQNLLEMKTGLAMIKDLPTARLERLLVEHLDLCHYRLDAWMLGLVNQRLADLRQPEGKPTGLFLGAYGYLEDIRVGSNPGLWVTSSALSFADGGNRPPSLDNLVVPIMHAGVLEGKGLSLEKLLRNSFIYLGEEPASELVKDLHSGRIIARPPLDTQGEGFIHTPSLAHANAAAILRSGYATYRSPGQNRSKTDPFSVNLSSRRVREALFLLEGIRNGQGLGALLGYQLERSLYEYADQEPPDVNFVSKVPGYISDLRQHFPQQTRKELSDPASVFMVVDGLALLEAVGEHSGPGHWSVGKITNCPPAHQQILDREVEHLEESLDGLSDLLMAESVFQMTKGNPERAAAALKVLNDGAMMENPEVIDTPRNGFSYMQRTGILCGPAAGNQPWTTNPSPLSMILPDLNDWIARQLPAPGQCGGTARTTDNQLLAWSLADLEVQPIDLVLVFTDGDPASPFSAFSFRVTDHLRNRHELDAAQEISLDLRQTALSYTVLEILPLVHSISQLIRSARPLGPDDLYRPSQRQDGQASAKWSLEQPLAGFQNLLEGDGPFSVGTLIQRLEEIQIRLDTEMDPAETEVLFELLLRVAGFGIPEALPQAGRAQNPENLLALKLQAGHVLILLKKKYAEALKIWNTLDAAQPPQEKAQALTLTGQEIFGRSFTFFPGFQLPAGHAILEGDNLLERDDPGVAEWLQGAAMVRSRLATYQNLSLLREAFEVSDKDQAPAVRQFPAGAHPWVGNAVPHEELPSGDTLSLVLEMPEALHPGDTLWGMVVDEWNEFIPLPKTTTGVGFNYNQPDAEAPQVLLLAVTPELNGKWQWNDLMDTVTESMQLAKKRAVEPDQLRQTPLAHFLPAVVGPINEDDLYPAVDFAKNIKVESQ